MYLKKKNSIHILIPFVVIIILSILFIIKTPALKSNLEQEIRTALNEKYIYLSEKSLLSNFENLFLSLLYNKKNYPELKIEIPFKAFNIIKEDREKALRYGLLEKAREVKGTINLNGRNFNADFRLKGNLPDHWNNTKQWSLKVSLKENESIFGFSEFSIVQHRTREYPYSELVTKNLVRMGVKTPKYTSAKIILNGQKWGLMQIEESFSNSFLEKRQLKKKPIYKISNEDDLILGWKYFENGLRGLKNYSINEDQLKILSKWLGKFEIKSLNMKSNFINSSNLSNENPINISLHKDQKLIETILYKANSEKNEYFNEIRNNFDIQSISDAIISSIIWGEQHFHSIEAHNARFYLNPFTKLIEIFPNDHAHTFILDVNKPNIINQIKNMPYLFRILFFNDNIQDNINLSIIKFKKNLSLIESDFNNICRNNKIICKKKVKLTCKSYNLDNCRETYYLDEIINNIEFLEKNYHEIFSENNFNKNLNKKKIDLDENWVAREVTNKIYVYENENEFKIINLIPYDIIIDNIEIYNDDNSLNNIIELKKILNKSNLNKFSELNINFKKQHKGKILYYKINYYLKNSDIRLNQTFIKNNIKINKSQSSKKLNQILKFDGKKYFIKEGQYIVSEPIIIPSGYNLKINEGTKIIFTNYSYILINDGSIELNGSKDKPIILTTDKENSDNTWNGIYVKSKNQSKSIINFTNINNLNYFKSENFFLTGGVNFYNVELDMNNVNFNNCHSEDCLNVTKSKINLKNIKFSDAKSDGIDLDFVDGKIKNFQINRIKGDGVDVSGSNLIIENMNIKNIQDKCISIGEDSFTELINIDLENCKFGLVIKDSGSSKVKNIKINNVEDYDVAIYKKKTFYDNPLEVKIGNIKSKNKFFSQKDTSLEIDNTRIKNTILSTKKINQIF